MRSLSRSKQFLLKIPVSSGESIVKAQGAIKLCIYFQDNYESCIFQLIRLSTIMVYRAFWQMLTHRVPQYANKSCVRCCGILFADSNLHAVEGILKKLGLWNIYVKSNYFLLSGNFKLVFFTKRRLRSFVLIPHSFRKWLFCIIHVS